MVFDAIKLVGKGALFWGTSARTLRVKNLQEEEGGGGFVTDYKTNIL